MESIHKVRVCVAMKAPVGLLSGRAVLRSKMEGRCPDKLRGICDREHHGLNCTSRWFYKFYYGKAMIVGLIHASKEAERLHEIFFVLKKNLGLCSFYNRTVSFHFVIILTERVTALRVK